MLPFGQILSAASPNPVDRSKDGEYQPKLDTDQMGNFTLTLPDGNRITILKRGRLMASLVQTFIDHYGVRLLTARQVQRFIEGDNRKIVHKIIYQANQNNLKPVDWQIYKDGEVIEEGESRFAYSLRKIVPEAEETTGYAKGGVEEKSTEPVIETEGPKDRIESNDNLSPGQGEVRDIGRELSPSVKRWFDNVADIGREWTERNKNTPPRELEVLTPGERLFSGITDIDMLIGEIESLYDRVERHQASGQEMELFNTLLLVQRAMGFNRKGRFEEVYPGKF